MAYRIDFSKLDGATVDANGFLIAEAKYTRTGVFSYLNFDGTISKELRHPDDVFEVESLKSAQSQVVTNDHPPMMLYSDNAKEYGVGFTSEKVDVIDNVFVGGSIKVVDEKAIGDVMQGGKNQLSEGYLCDIIDESGNWEGQEYNKRQKNIRYNHLSIVWEGRAGPDVKMKTDAAGKDFAVMKMDAEENHEKKTCKKDAKKVPLSQELKKMEIKKMKFKIDSVEFEAEDTIAKAVQGKIDSLSDSVSKAEAKADALAKQIQERDAEIEKIKTDLSDEATIGRAQSLIVVKEFAKEILGEDKKDTIENLKKAVCEKMGINLDKKDSVYLNASFETLMATHKPAEKKDELAEHIEQNAGKKQDSIDDKIKAHMDALSNRWKVKQGVAVK